MRTGAASGVATRFLARDDARVVGIIGTGWQARAQLEAIALVRKLDRVRAHSRDAQRRDQFAREMSALLGVPVVAVTSCEEAVRDADIVVTSTTSKNPVVEGRWLKPGTHINAIGVNLPFRRELDAEAVLRSDVIVADSCEQSKLEAGDLIQAFGKDESKWESVRELGQIVSGSIAGRTTAAQITLFKSNGVATEDVVVAGRLYEIALKQKVGREIAMWAK
jgi:ornithine cyclodeaminase/alanine dehydrogenase-like protein (mu-crystallin family)